MPGSLTYRAPFPTSPLFFRYPIMLSYLKSMVSVLNNAGWSASLLGSATVTATKGFRSLVIETTGDVISVEIAENGESLTFSTYRAIYPRDLLARLSSAFDSL